MQTQIYLMYEKVPNCHFYFYVLKFRSQDTGWLLLEVFLMITNHFPYEYLQICTCSVNTSRNTSSGLNIHNSPFPGRLLQMKAINHRVLDPPFVSPWPVFITLLTAPLCDGLCWTPLSAAFRSRLPSWIFW